MIGRRTTKYRSHQTSLASGGGGIARVSVPTESLPDAHSDQDSWFGAIFILQYANESTETHYEYLCQFCYSDFGRVFGSYATLRRGSQHGFEPRPRRAARYHFQHGGMVRAAHEFGDRPGHRTEP